MTTTNWGCKIHFIVWVLVFAVLVDAVAFGLVFSAKGKVGKHDRDSVWELGVKAAFCLGTSSLMSLGAAFFLWCYKIKEETKTTIQRVSWFTLLYLVAILGVCIGGETCLAKVVKWGNGISDDDLRAKTNLTIVMFCCGLEAFFTVVYSLYIYDIRGAVFHHDYTGDPL